MANSKADAISIVPDAAVATVRSAASSFASMRSQKRREHGAPTAHPAAAGARSTTAARRSVATFIAPGCNRQVSARSGGRADASSFLRVEADGRLIAVHVDSSDPTAWRREPYYRTLKQFAIKGADINQQVIVYIKNRVIAIFPNKEVEVGTMNPGDHLVVREVGGPNGRDWIAFIEAAGEPAAQ